MLLPATISAWRYARWLSREQSLEGGWTEMAKPPLLVKIQVGPRCIRVPGEHVLIGASGFFVRDVQLLAGTRVMVQFSRERDQVSLPGTVCAHYGNLGLSVEFKERSGLAVERLGTLRAA